MADMNELYVAYRHKKTLEQQLAILKRDEKAAEQLVNECRVRCQKENLDVQKFEGNEFKQFWLKLRGEFDKQQLENSAKTAKAMRELHDARAKAFDIALEKRDIELQLEKLDGIEPAYEEALKRQLDHLDYSVYREDIIRMRDKIANDSYQLTVLEYGKSYATLAKRTAKNLFKQLEDISEVLRAMNAADEPTKMDVRTKIQESISLSSELRVQLHQLDQNLSEIDAMEADEVAFADKLTINIPSLFYNEALDAELDTMALAKAKKELIEIQAKIESADERFDVLNTEIAETKEHHQNQLEEYVKNSVEVLK